VPGKTFYRDPVPAFILPIITHLIYRSSCDAAPVRDRIMTAQTGEGVGRRRWPAHFWKIGSSAFVSGWIWNRPSQSAADDPEGSYRAGSESVPSVCGAQPAPIEDAISVGTMVIMDDRGTFRSLCTRAERLFQTNDDERRRAPRRLAKVAKLSRTSSIASFHSASGLMVGSVSGLGRSLTKTNSDSNGLFGKRRMRAPKGMDARPRARETTHSMPPMLVTWKAAPPTNTRRT